MNDKDGLYYRDTKSGLTRGPLTVEEFHALREKGDLPSKTTRAWRLRGGAVFRIVIERKRYIGTMLSLPSLGYFIEFLMMVLCFLAITFAFTRPKMIVEVQSSMLMLVLVVATVVLTLGSLYMTLGRLNDASSKVVIAELPV